MLGALGDVAMRAYREGVASERTRSALSFIARSIPLRNAVERDDPQAARAAALALIATGHMTNLRVLARRAGARRRRRPRRARAAARLDRRRERRADRDVRRERLGRQRLRRRRPAASPRASPRCARTDAASPARSHSGPGEPPPQGTLTVKGTDYAYTSFPAAAYPTGQLRVYLLKPIPSIAPLCGKTAQDTLVNTLSRVARLIYTSEGGAHALTQVQRVQRYQPLLRAVAARDPAPRGGGRTPAARARRASARQRRRAAAVATSAGPYVLAPVHAPLRLNGRTIGAIELSIQDDEGYKRLAGRLAGLDVLMYMGSQLVKNSLGPAPGTVPASGTYRYRGRTFRVYTLHAHAFPSGPLRIVVLIPIPYS